VALPVIVTTTATAAILMALVVYGALRSRGMAPPVGMAGTAAAVPPGSLGVVRRPIEPLGSVYAGGEEWSARSADSKPIRRDTPVRIVARDGLTLVVEPDPSSSPVSL
jgi:membrane-bound ClpP family serine protease